MGGINGNGSGQAIAVDYQIQGQGDAATIFIENDGARVTTACLVPPFPK